MYVLVSSHDGVTQVTIREVDNFRDLHVEFRGVGEGVGAVALQDAGFGRLGGGYAWLEVAALRAGGRDTKDWLDQYDGMLTFAAESGWLSADGALVRAHLAHE